MRFGLGLLPGVGRTMRRSPAARTGRCGSGGPGGQPVLARRDSAERWVRLVRSAAAVVREADADTAGGKMVLAEDLRHIFGAEGFLEPPAFTAARMASRMVIAGSSPEKG